MIRDGWLTSRRRDMCACRRVQAAPIPDEILHEIWTQNKGFWQDMHMFDDDYIRFLWQFLQTKDAEMGMLPAAHCGARPAERQGVVLLVQRHMCRMHALARFLFLLIHALPSHCPMGPGAVSRTTPHAPGTHTSTLVSFLQLCFSFSIFLSALRASRQS
jgi:hypothetical protein